MAVIYKDLKDAPRTELVLPINLLDEDVDDWKSKLNPFRAQTTQLNRLELGSEDDEDGESSYIRLSYIG